MGIIRFQSNLYKIGARSILRLPQSASTKLPSRGIVCVEGSINEVPFRAVLEPDGNGSHWFSVSSTLRKAAQIGSGSSVRIAIEASKDWPEPAVPADLENALAASQQAEELWKDITPMARWDWIWWISSTTNPDTRQRRVAATCDKLNKGERRPCCFNRTLCTDPVVSKNGVLMEPH